MRGSFHDGNVAEATRQRRNPSEGDNESQGFRCRPQTSNGEDRLARADQVAHFRYDGGRKRPWSELMMKVIGAVREEGPEGGRSSGGYRAVRGLNRRVLRRIRERRKALKAGAAFWSSRATGGRGDGRTARGQQRATSSCGFSRGKDPEERTLDVAAG